MTPSKCRTGSCWTISGGTWTPPTPGGNLWTGGRNTAAPSFTATRRKKRLAEESKAALGKSGRFSKAVVTEILPLGTFYPAEDYHQNYYKTHTLKYKYYRFNSGRDQFIDKVWGKGQSRILGVGAAEAAAPPEARKYTKPGIEVLRKKLTPLNNTK